MADTIIGTVPDQWDQVPLADLCGIVPGPSGQEFSQLSADGEGPGILRPVNVHGGLIASDAVTRLKRTPQRDLRRYQLSPGDLLLTRVAQVGRIAVVVDQYTDWLFNTGLMRLRCNQRVDSQYLLHYLMFPQIQNWMQQNSSGTAITGITKQALSALPVVLPPREVQSTIVEPLKALTEKIAIHQEIISTTAQLRDAVAQRMFRGDA